MPFFKVRFNIFFSQAYRAHNKNKPKMSWGEYLSNLKKEGLKHAAICGTDNASWVQVSDGSNVRSFPERIVSCSKLLSLIFRGVGCVGVGGLKGELPTTESLLSF